jgi:hypothetical protein
MNFTQPISKDFVVIPARWKADSARERILSHRSISHAIVVPELYCSLYSPSEAAGLVAGKDFDLPKINIEVTQRPWSKLRVSPSGRLYVVGRNELLDLDDEEREKFLWNLIQLRRWRPVRLISQSTLPVSAPGRAVIFNKARLAGILDVQKLKGGIRVPSVDLKTGSTEFIAAVPGSSRPPSNIPPSGGGGDEPPSGDFNAFPRLDAPNDLESGQEFTAVVGYRPDPDPTLAGSEPLYVKNPPPDATIRLSVSAFGARILNQSAHKLPLKMEAEAKVRCIVEPGAEKVTLFADYFYHKNLIGGARREIAVTIPGKEPVRIEKPGGKPARITTPTDASAVDLEVIIRTVGDELDWKLYGLNEELVFEGRKPIRDTRDFAQKILSGLTTYSEGVLATRTLQNHSGTIARAIPREFFDALRAVHRKTKKRPVVLIHTDEMYVPWELAEFDPPLKKSYGPKLLGAQAVIGRWLEDEAVPVPPPTDVSLNTVCIFASAYGENSDVGELPEALIEQKNLKRNLRAYGLKAEGYEADLVNVEHLLKKRVRPGLAIHFAVHGHRDVLASEAHLVLSDSNQLSPEALAGRRDLGQPARFDFVFINACQIATPDKSLGQAAGFPGALIREGATAFLAPLWDVYDITARRIAEAFYSKTLQEKVSAAEFITGRRAKFKPNGTTTPLAYVFYGHPRLRFTKMVKE